MTYEGAWAVEEEVYCRSMTYEGAWAVEGEVYAPSEYALLY